MTKPPKRLKIRIPAYAFPRNTWRRRIHEAVSARQALSPVTYGERDKLEVELLLYFDDVALSFHDVDNRVKDVLDALQGRAGGPKSEMNLRPIIPNDKQIYRVVVEKKLIDPRSHGLGHLTIRRFSGWRLIQVPPKARRPRKVPLSNPALELPGTGLRNAHDRRWAGSSAPRR